MLSVTKENCKPRTVRTFEAELSCTFTGLVIREPPHEREVVGSIPSDDRPKSLRLVVVAFLLALRIIGIALRLAHQCQDNGLVKYWLK